ncbi:glycine C-acetyltransferase [Halarsenatibacter silvermanii]|uniref:8-amino-7-ketopelargonate synthase n=1 Tax=Halarsenatibacter silvermanii TaxID=321763 RepID=A0A1G9QDV9_9FIRM|nr:glycine C-acetyltransferase [Halarsenatibacter silvermanii]SDM09262.1 glycine C-acetyltransferase [Halarsenatibacter silvermanii]
MNENFEARLQDDIAELKEEGLYNRIRTLESPQGAWVDIEGEEKLNFCSNNYLGLANHHELVEAAQRAVDKYGVGPGAVRTIAGTMELHRELEEKLADFKKVEATLTFQSGFNANLAVIPAITGEDDVIISDELNHASIIDGCRLSRADLEVYEHADMDSLESVLEEVEARHKLIVTDGVFSMDGDIAPLPEIVELAEEHDAVVMVDDAHGEGVLGSHGRGIVDHFDLHGDVDIEVGTFSKAFGTVGGAIAGSETLVEFLRQKGRPFLFSSAVTPPDLAATIRAVEILEENNDLVKMLWNNAEKFQKEMKAAGFDVGGTETPITPVILGEAETASRFSERLFEEGIFAQSIGFPTVPRGEARIRVMISASHGQDDLEFALDKFKKIGLELDIIE